MTFDLPQHILFADSLLPVENDNFAYAVISADFLFVDSLVHNIHGVYKIVSDQVFLKYVKKIWQTCDYKPVFYFV